MADTKEGSHVFAVTCPCRGATLWVDGETKAVLRSEKAKKQKGSLDDLLVKEQERRSGFDRKFEAAVQLQKEKHTKADELFKKALEKAEKSEGEEET